VGEAAGVSEVGGLFVHFFMLACMAVGGLSTVMPDMQRYVVNERGLVSAREFADAYALAQASPGPNALWVTLVGLQAAGWLGAAAAIVAVLLPASVFSLLAVALHARRPDAPLALAVRRGLAPVAVGLMFSSGWLLLSSVGHGWQGYAAALLAMCAVLFTRKLNPLVLLALGALAGIMGVV
jgi:chromate transporter